MCYKKLISKKINSLFSKKNNLISIHKEIILVALTYIFLAVWFFGRSFLNEYISGDLLGYTIPTHFFIFQSLKEGFIPLWQPYNYLGLPLIFQLGGAYFYPGVWLVFLFNLLINHSNSVNLFGKTVELFIYLHIILAMMGMYILLRKKINLSWTASFVGGCIFGFSLFTTSNTGGNIAVLYSQAYLPIIIYFLLNYIGKNSFKNFIFFVIINYVLFTFLYPYYLIYFIYAQLGLGLLFGWRIFLKTGISIFTAFLLSGFFLFPALNSSSQAYRILGAALDPQFHTKSAAIPTYIINTLIPQGIFTGGLLTWGTIPLIFLILGFVNLKMNKVNIWLIFIFVFSVVFALGGYIGIENLLGMPPFFIDKLRSHGQILILAFFSGIIILSHGIDNALNGDRNRIVEILLWSFLGLALLFALVLPFFNINYMKDSKEMFVVIGRPFILLGIGLILYRFIYKYKSKIFLIAILILTFFEFHYYFDQLEYIKLGTSYRKYMQVNSLIPEIPSENNLFRYFFANDQFAHNASYLKVFGYQGYEGGPYSAFYELDRLKSPVNWQYANIKYIVGTEPIKDFSDSNYKLLSTVSPQSHPDETFASSAPGFGGWTPKSQNTHYIYELKNYLPRFFIPGVVQTCPDKDCYIREKLGELVYVNEENIDIVNPSKKDVELKILSYKPNGIKIEVNTPKETFVSSSEIWDKGWKIKINGKDSYVYNVSKGFRGFKVPQGHSDVMMYYVPPYFNFGLLVSLSGLIFIFILYKRNFFTNKKLSIN